MQKLVGLVALLAMALGGCSDDSESATQPSATSTLPTMATAPVEPTTSAPPLELVGEWQRVTTCQQRVSALKAAGLERFAAEHAAGEGWIPGITSVDQLENPKQPCEGAVPLKHSHFFTADGFFGSRDDRGNQVDDGTYRIIDDRSFKIANVTFIYKILGGDTLKLYPVMPDCAPKGCFDAQWAVAVSYIGLPWKRIS